MASMSNANFHHAYLTCRANNVRCSNVQARFLLTANNDVSTNAGCPPPPMSFLGPLFTSRRPSSYVVSDLSEDVSTSQLQHHAMEDEIANHGQTFAYPSPELARMFYPKRLKPDIKATEELLLLHQYGCMVDARPFQDALNAGCRRATRNFHSTSCGNRRISISPLSG